MPRPCQHASPNAGNDRHLGAGGFSRRALEGRRAGSAALLADQRGHGGCSAHRHEMEADTLRGWHEGTPRAERRDEPTHGSAVQ